MSLAGVVWGTIGPGVQLVHDGSGLAPLAISAYRAIAAVAVLLVISLVTGRLTKSWSLARHQWRRVTVVGLLTAAFQMLFFVAVVATGVSVATVVCLGFAPVLLLVVSSAEQRRSPPPVTPSRSRSPSWGCCSSASPAVGDQTPHPGLGILAALGSGAAYGCQRTSQLRSTQRLDPLTVTSRPSPWPVVLVPGGLVRLTCGARP